MTQPSEESKKQYRLSEKGKAQRKAHYESKKAFYQEYERNRQYQKMYGITVIEYETMLALQNGGCKMCGTTRGGPKRQRLVIDHCHRTGRVRGLLCTKCNVAVGFYEKNCGLIHKYLENA